jgi:hypothetical protein
MSSTKPSDTDRVNNLDADIDKKLARVANLQDTLRKAAGQIVVLQNSLPCAHRCKDEHGIYYVKSCYRCESIKLNEECVRRCAQEMDSVGIELARLGGLRIAEYRAELGPFTRDTQTVDLAIHAYNKERIRVELHESKIADLNVQLRMGEAYSKWMRSTPDEWALDSDMHYDRIRTYEVRRKLDQAQQRLSEMIVDRADALRRLEGMRAIKTDR